MQAQSKRSEEDEAFEAFNIAKGGKATQWRHFVEVCCVSLCMCVVVGEAQWFVSMMCHGQTWRLDERACTVCAWMTQWSTLRSEIVYVLHSGDGTLTSLGNGTVGETCVPGVQWQCKPLLAHTTVAA